MKLEPLRLLAHPSNHLFRGCFLGGGGIYGGHPSALLSSRQCHELRPTFPYADLKHFGLPSSPDLSAFFKKSVEPLKVIPHCLLQRLSCVSSYGLASSQFRLLKRLPVIWFICKTLAALTPSVILQMRFSHPAMICFALLLKPCPLLQHNNREIMVFARRQHSNSGQPREL